MTAAGWLNPTRALIWVFTCPHKCLCERDALGEHSAPSSTSFRQLGICFPCNWFGSHGDGRCSWHFLPIYRGKPTEQRAACTSFGNQSCVLPNCCANSTCKDCWAVSGVDLGMQLASPAHAASYSCRAWSFLGSHCFGTKEAL